MYDWTKRYETPLLHPITEKFTFVLVYTVMDRPLFLQELDKGS